MEGNELNMLLVILAFGSLVFLSFLTISNPLKVNRKANIWFGACLLVWSTFWTEEVVSLAFHTEVSRWTGILIRFIQCLLPIIIYYSTVFFTNPNYRFRKIDSVYLVLPAIFLALLIVNSYIEEKTSVFNFLLALIILVQLYYFVYMSYVRIKKHQRKLMLFASNTSGINLKWLEYIILLILLTGILAGVYNLFMELAIPNTFMNTIFLVVVYSIGYYTLKQKEIFPAEGKQRDEIISMEEEVDFLPELKRKILSDEERDLLKLQLIELMQVQKPYLDSELNLVKLAALMNVSSHQLSYVINTGFNENFFRFINQYRVEKAKELLLQEEMNRLSILGIAFESGFNSKTSFNTTFKKFTGQTPSGFKEMRSNL